MARLLFWSLVLWVLACTTATQAQMFFPPLPPTNPTVLEGTAKDGARPLAQAVQYFHPRFSPDGKRIAFLRGPAADAATEIRVMNRDGTRSTCIVTLEAVRKAATRVYRKYTDASEAIPLQLQEVTTISYLEWLPSSDRLMCGAATSRAEQYLFFTVTLRGRLTFIDTPLLNFHSSGGDYYFRAHIPVALSPDGTQLAILGYNCLFIADLLQPMSFYDANTPARFTGISADVHAYADACWGSDGRIYFIDQRARLFAVSPQGVLTQLQRTDASADATHRYASPVVSPDGTYLAYLCDGRVRLREFASGLETEMRQDQWTTTRKILRWTPPDILLIQTHTEVARETAPLPDAWDTLQMIPVTKRYGQAITRYGHLDADLSPDGMCLAFVQDGSLYVDRSLYVKAIHPDQL